MRAWHDEQADWNVVAADTGDRRQALDRASSIPAPRTFYQGVSGVVVTPWAGRARGRGAHGGGQGRLRGVVDSFFLARTFVTLLVITDPVGTVPVFISMTTTASGRERNRAAWQAVLVAGLVIATFALFGQQILLYLDISLPSLQAAGGLLLLVVALDLLRGDVGALAGGSTTNIAFVPLGTPLLAGPGAIAAVMVFARQADRPDERLGVALGLVGVLAVLYLSLRFSGLLLRVLRQAGVDQTMESARPGGGRRRSKSLSWSTAIPMTAAWPTPDLRGRRDSARTFDPATPGARRPKRPLLEGQTPALCIEPDDPQVPVGLAHRVAVADLQARHASVTLDRHDLAIHGEDFLGSFAYRLPHDGDGSQTLEGLLKGSGLVGRLGCKQLGQHLGARRSPSSLVQRNPRLHPSTVHPATLSPVRSRRPGNVSDLLHAINGTVAQLRPIWPPSCASGCLLGTVVDRH